MTVTVVLIGSQECARMLDCSTTAVTKMRRSGRLRAARRNPFRYRLEDVEALRVTRLGKARRRAHGVEIVQEER
jgi:Helix-turn-helix domain